MLLNKYAYARTHFSVASSLPRSLLHTSGCILLIRSENAFRIDAFSSIYLMPSLLRRVIIPSVSSGVRASKTSAMTTTKDDDFELLIVVVVYVVVVVVRRIILSRRRRRRSRASLGSRALLRDKDVHILSVLMGNLLPLWSAVGCLLPLTLSTVLPKLSVILSR